ncbi:MAG: universal stress protein [Beijerinckiaceae bacterium]|nr:universal stress protein [Beijerinckiaceae bacterium]MDO9439567.1 universal stress protein [Beijerinckiaceae bacterium]
MAIKDILLLLETGDSAAVAAPYAVALASEFGAHLTASGVAFEIMPPASFMGGDYPYEALAAVTEEARKRAEEAYARMRASAPDTLTTDIVQIDAFPGQARDEFARLSRHFDLTVAAQAPLDDGDDQGLAEAALFGGGRPVLVVPRIHKAAPKFDRALIAWDGSRAAARALADAMPFLEKSRTIEVVTVTDHRVSFKELPGFNITRHLSRHGLRAELKRLTIQGDIGDTLLSYAADAGSDFLVMGGYGHSRLREMILGGTTRTIMSTMTIPILISH